MRVTYELQLGLPGDWLIEQHRRAPPEPAGNDLESVLTRLQEVEINDRARPAAARLCAGKPDLDRNIVPTSALAHCVKRLVNVADEADGVAERVSLEMVSRH